MAKPTHFFGVRCSGCGHGGGHDHGCGRQMSRCALRTTTQLQRTVAPSGSDLTEYHLRCTRCIRLIDATARQGPNMLHDLQVRSAKHLLIDLHEIQLHDDKYSHYGVAAKH